MNSRALNFSSRGAVVPTGGRVGEDQFGTVDAMKYLVGEKFLNYLDAAERDAEFPAFVAEIKTIFEPWQIAEYLEKAGWTEPFDPSLYDEDDEDYDPEVIEMERKDNIRRVAKELVLIERAKEWLLGEDGSLQGPGEQTG